MQTMSVQGPRSLDRARLRTGLILVLIGGPLVVVDFTIGLDGSTPIDILNDTIGLALLLWGTVLLSRLEVSPVYSSRLNIVLSLTVLLLVWSIVVQAGPQLGRSVVTVLTSGLAVGGTILFCTSMKHLCETHGFARSLQGWARASAWVTIVYGGGWAISSLLTLIRSASEGSLSPSGVYLDIGAGGVLLLAVLLLALILVPLIMVTIAISQLLGESRVAPGAPPVLPV
jgi:hypothetical protein